MEVFTIEELKMEENKLRYCTILLIDDDKHCKIFISEKSKYYIKNDNESIYTEILNEFKDIRKSYKINFKDNIFNKYYNVDYEPNNMKHCTILLIDDDNHSKIFICEKNLYNIGVKHYVYDNYHDYINGDYDDYCYELFYIPLNNFECLVSGNNNITNLIKNNNNNYGHKITLLVDNINIFIYENVY